MPTPKVKLFGDKALIKKFGDTALVKSELTDATQKSVILFQARAASYPRQRPGSSYHRTRNLGNNWKTQVKSFASGVRGFVENAVTYGGYVMGPGEQASVHKGVWATTRMILKEKKKQIVGFFETALSNIRKGF